MVIWETQIPLCVPMFIQGRAAIVGQIERDFFQSTTGFDIWPLPSETGEWAHTHSMNQAERSLPNVFPNTHACALILTDVCPDPAALSYLPLKC